MSIIKHWKFWKYHVICRKLGPSPASFVKNPFKTEMPTFLQRFHQASKLPGKWYFIDLVFILMKKQNRIKKP